MNRRSRRLSGFSLVLATFWIYPVWAQHTVHVTPSNVQWGYFASDAKPVLTVKSGEVVTIDTIVGIPEMLEQLCALLWPIDVNDPDTCKHARKTARGKSANLLN